MINPIPTVSNILDKIIKNKIKYIDFFSLKEINLFIFDKIFNFEKIYLRFYIFVQILFINE